jgi:hypothetical protein
MLKKVDVERQADLIRILSSIPVAARSSATAVANLATFISYRALSSSIEDRAIIRRKS